MTADDIAAMLAQLRSGEAGAAGGVDAPPQVWDERALRTQPSPLDAMPAIRGGRSLPGGQPPASPAPMAQPGPAMPEPVAQSSTPGFMGKLGSVQPGLSREQLAGPGLMPAILADQPMALSKPMDTSQLVQNVRTKGPGFFDKDGRWKQVLSDALLGIGASFGNPLAVASLKDRFAQRSEDREDKRLMQRKLLEWQLEQRKPQYANNGKSWVRYDPLTGKAEQIFRSPSDEQQFASDLGLTEGSQAYYNAIRDKGLGAQGPTNMAFRLKEMQDQSARGWAGLKDQSARGWAGINEDRLHHRTTEAQNGSEITPSKVVGPILNKIASGKALTAGEQAALDRYKAMDPLNQYIGSMLGGGGMPAAPAAPAPAPRQAAPAPAGPRRGQTATNPRTGQTVTFDGKAWRDASGRLVR